MSSTKPYKPLGSAIRKRRKNGCARDHRASRRLRSILHNSIVATLPPMDAPIDKALEIVGSGPSGRAFVCQLLLRSVPSSDAPIRDWAILNFDANDFRWCPDWGQLLGPEAGFRLHAKSR